jgi:murein DD-endopeptidase MepM/ murein hydrolase activator NlpD
LPKKRVLWTTARYVSADLQKAAAEMNLTGHLTDTEALGYLRLLEHLPAQPPAIGAVSSPFGTRIAPHRGFSYAARYHQAGSRFGREEFHSGIDIAVPPGTPVRAPGPGLVIPGPGLVIATGRSPRLGTYVRLLHEEVQLETVLAHLSRVTGGLKRGQPVRRGEVVGFSGNSGRRHRSSPAL